jgi:four helix bundle protein
MSVKTLRRKVKWQKEKVCREFIFLWRLSLDFFNKVMTVIQDCPDGSYVQRNIIKRIQVSSLKVSQQIAKAVSAEAKEDLHELFFEAAESVRLTKAYLYAARKNNLINKDKLAALNTISRELLKKIHVFNSVVDVDAEDQVIYSER